MLPRTAARRLALLTTVSVALGVGVACGAPSDGGRPIAASDVVIADRQEQALLAPAALTEAPAWHLAWRAETIFPNVTETTTTCRFATRLTASGTALRAEFGSSGAGDGYRLLAASVARPQAPGSLDVAETSSLPLTFGGDPSVDVHTGDSIVSDPLPMTVAADSDVLVTVTASAGDAYGKASTTDPGACSSGPVAEPATVAARDLPTPGLVRWLRSVQVQGPEVRSVVALGDSLTEGPGGVEGYQRWSDLLVRPGVAVVNAGAGGNTISRRGVFGTLDGVSRARALLAQPNVDDVVLLIGTNDLALDRSGEQILAGMDEVAAAAADAGVRLWIGTLLPRGRGVGSWTERNRLEVNEALHTRRFADKGVQVIETGDAVSDPDSPNRLRPELNAGDGIHLDVEGTQVLSRTIGQALGLSDQ